jgi:hypothetical protein
MEEQGGRNQWWQQPETEFQAASSTSPEAVPEISRKTPGHEMVHDMARKDEQVRARALPAHGRQGRGRIDVMSPAQEVEPAHRFAHDVPPMHAGEGEVPLELTSPPAGALRILGVLKAGRDRLG